MQRARESGGTPVAVLEPVPASAKPNIEPRKAEAPKPEAAKAETKAETKIDRKAAENLFPFAVTVGAVYDGPLDLLLDLIRKQDIDIYDIPIARLTAQFLHYIERMKQLDIELCSEFVYTAALLIHIKSKMLLPRSPDPTADEPEDPRTELVERLIEHERFKSAAQMLHQKQQIEEAVWTNPGVRDFKRETEGEREIAADAADLAMAFGDVLRRLKTRPAFFQVDEESVTVGQMIEYVHRRLLMEDGPVRLRKLLGGVRSRRGLLCTFLAMLELVRLQAILLRQDRVFGEILIKKHERFDAVFGEGSTVRDDWR